MEKSASHAGNVNNVNNVKSRWGLLEKSGDGFNIINIVNISPARSKNASGRGNVNNVNNVKSL